MSAAEKLPWQELAMTAEECGQLWGRSGRLNRCDRSGRLGAQPLGDAAEPGRLSP